MAVFIACDRLVTFDIDQSRASLERKKSALQAQLSNVNNALEQLQVRYGILVTQVRDVERLLALMTTVAGSMSEPTHAR